MNKNPLRRLLVLCAISLATITTLLTGADMARALSGPHAKGQIALSPPALEELDAFADLALQETTFLSMTKQGELLDDVDGDGNVSPGDTLQYTIMVTNSGLVDANGVRISDDLHEGLSLLGDVRISPIAADHHYDVLGNTVITRDATTGVLQGAVILEPGTITATAVLTTGTTTEGGDITLQADGSFTYDPPAGFSGTDTFAYEIVHENGMAGRGTVTFEVGTVIWYVDHDAGDDGDGRQSAPFSTPSDVEGQSGVGDIIFLYTGSFSGGLTLENGQRLIGQGVALGSAGGLTVPDGSTLPGAGSRPTLAGGVTLAENNHIYGLTLSAGSTNGTALSGSGFGLLTVADTAISGAGRALDLHDGTVAAAFSELSSTNSTSQGVRLSQLQGSLIASSGAISGAAGNSFEVSSNRSATITYPGTITANNPGSGTTPYAVRIFDSSGGRITLTGAISSSNGAGGVNLSNNGSTTIYLDGLLTLNTSSNSAFVASGGGQVRAAAAGNTVTTSGATAVSIENVTIEDSISFKSVSAANSTRGIVLNSIQGGSFEITGEESEDGSGGTLSSISQRAIEVISSDNVTFANMALTNANTADSGAAGVCDAFSTTGCYAAIYLRDAGSIELNNVDISGSTKEQAINGVNVDGFTLRNSSITACGDQVEEGCIKMRNLTGDALLDSVNLSFAAAKVVEIHNSSGSLTLTVSNSTFRDTQTSASGADGLELMAYGQAEIYAAVSGSQFLRNRTNGLQAGAEDSGSMSLDVSGSTFNAFNASGKGLELSVIEGGSLAFNVMNNPLIASYGGNAITVAAFDNGVVDGRINGNSNIRGGGPDIAGNGIHVQANDNVSGRIAIQGNGIGEIGFDDGIFVTVRPDYVATATGRLDVTIVNNTIDLHPAAYADIELFVQGTNTLCADVRDNTASGGGAYAFRVREADTTATMLLEGYTSNAATTWTARGNSGAGVSESPVAGTAAAADCSEPQNPAPVTQGSGARVVQQSVQPAESRTHSDTFAEAETSEASPRRSQPAPLIAARLAAVPAQQAGADVDVGSFTLPAGKSVTIIYAAVIADPFPAGAPQVQNQALVRYNGNYFVVSDDPHTPERHDPTVIVVAAAPDLALEKDAGIETAEPGETVPYTLTYRNSGNQHAAQVVITETVPAAATFNASESSAGWSCADGSASGTACTLEVDEVNAGAPEASVIFAVDVNDTLPAGVEQLLNEATIGVDGAGINDANFANNDAGHSTTLLAQPDLAVTKQDGGAAATPGMTLAYTLSYSNVGNQGATGVVIHEVVPEHSAFNGGASTVGWVCENGGGAGASCSLAVGTLEAGHSGAVTFAVTAENPVAASVTQLTNSASIEDDGTNGADSDTTNNVDAIETDVNATPELYLEKDDGDITARSGERITYELTVENRGNRGAVGVVITDSVPAHTRFNAIESDEDWSCTPDGEAGSVCTLELDGELVGSGSITTQFVVDVVSPLPAGVAVVQNQAQAAGSNAPAVNSDDPNTSEALDLTVTALEVRANLTVTIDDGLTVATPGQTLTYTVVAQNQGPDAVQGVMVSFIPSMNLIADSWSCEPGAGAQCGNSSGSGPLVDSADLGAGSAVTYTVNATILPPATGVLLSMAMVTTPATVTELVPADNLAQDLDTALTPQVDLQLGVSESIDPVVAGSGSSNLTYTLTVTNAGPSLATDVTVLNTLTLPGGVVVEGIDLDGPGSAYAGDEWSISSLNPGEGRTVTLRLTVGPEAAAGDAVEITSEIYGAGQSIVNAGDDRVVESTQIVRAVDVQLAASASVDTVVAGSGSGNLTFTITTTNTGPSTATGVVVENILELPAGVTLESVTPEAGSSWDGVNNRWDVGDLEAGESATLTVVVTIGAASLPGSDVVSSAATLAAVDEMDSDAGNDGATASSSVQTEADLVVSMTDTPDPVLAGAVLSYTVSVTNNGPSHAQNVQATTTLDSGLSVVQSDGCATDPGGVPLCALGTIAAGTTSEFVLSAAIDSGATGTLESSVAVSSDTTEGEPGEESDVESTLLEAEADLSVSLSAEPPTALAGYALTYTLAITNNGPSLATELSLDVTLPPALTVNAQSCAALVGSTLAVGAPVQCQFSGVLDAAFSGAISATAEVGASTPDGDLSNNSDSHTATVYRNLFSVSDAQATEGDAGTTALTFIITRTSNVIASTVDVATSNGSALAGVDFGALATTVTFEAGGSLTQTVTVGVTGDQVVELDETFTLQLSNAVNGGIEDTEGQATIVNDDSATVSIASVQQAEGDAGVSSFVFELLLSAAVDVDMSLDYATQDGTAGDESGDGDYLASSGTVTFAGDAGESEAIPVIVNGDGVMEDDEAFRVLLSNLSAAGRDVTLDGDEATGVIENDDVASVGFERANEMLGESDAQTTLTVTLSVPAAFTVTVDYESRDGSATGGSDYTPISGTLAFAPGQTAMGVTLAVLEDAMDEDDETVELWLDNLSAGVLASETNPATVVIVDDDGEPTVGFSDFEFAELENAGGAVITVTLSHVSGRDVSVVVNSSDGTALGGGDYGVVSETLTIAAGQRVATFTVPLLDDALDEEAETVTLTLSEAVNATLGAVNPATLLIEDEDGEPEINFTAAEYAFSESDTEVEVRITLSEVSGRDVTVVVQSRDGTATAGVDYGAVRETVTIAAGQLDATLNLPLLDDAEVEGDETVVLTLSDAVNGTVGGTDEATITIIDDDVVEETEYLYYFPYFPTVNR